LIKPIIKFDIVSVVTDIMFLKEKIFMIDYESTDMIDFLLENKKIKDFNVSKSTFYRKISKFRNTNNFYHEIGNNIIKYLLMPYG